MEDNACGGSGIHARTDLKLKKLHCCHNVSSESSIIDLCLCQSGHNHTCCQIKATQGRIEGVGGGYVLLHKAQKPRLFLNIADSILFCSLKGPGQTSMQLVNCASKKPSKYWDPCTLELWHLCFKTCSLQMLHGQAYCTDSCFWFLNVKENRRQISFQCLLSCRKSITGNYSLHGACRGVFYGGGPS